MILEKDLNEYRKGDLHKLVDKEEEFPIYAENNEKDVPPIKIQSQKIELDKNFNIQMIMPKIQVPKIHFPGVKIHIPKISRKKDEN